MYRRIAVLALTTNLLTSAPSISGRFICHKPEKGDATRLSANEYIVVVGEKSYREQQGSVKTSNDMPLENVLVEIFDTADDLLEDNSWNKQSEQKRLAACVTGPDGKFCFCHLPSGAYELRSSLSEGWNVTHVHIIVDKRAGQETKSS
jgi:hypothetical protein